MLRLAMEQKCEIATRECEELRAEIGRNREQAEKIQDGHRASIEEAELHLDETKKARWLGCACESVCVHVCVSACVWVRACDCVCV